LKNVKQKTFNRITKSMNKIRDVFRFMMIRPKFVFEESKFKLI